MIGGEEKLPNVEHSLTLGANLFEKKKKEEEEAYASPYRI